jgi:hypothetical protein
VAVGASMLAAALSLPQAAHPADIDGRFAIKGAGLKTCAEFNAARAGGLRDAALYGGWIEGYLSAVNQSTPDTFDIAPWQTVELILGIVAGVCERRPEARFIDVVNAFIRDSFPLRVARESPVETVRAADGALFMYAAVIEQIGARLAALGRFAGAPGPRFTPDLTAALAEFQRGEGLEATGVPDQRTLFHLFVAPRSPGPAP